LTSAAMVLAAYGVDTDPDRLNQYLTTNGGYTENGWVYWEKAAAVAPGGQVEKAYEDLPSYTLIDQNIMAGNPVIVRLTLSNGTTHFVVLVGKEGWNYLVQDPARAPNFGIYPLKNLTHRIEALRFFRVVPAH
jgi:predicted double-glycine peptidase